MAARPTGTAPGDLLRVARLRLAAHGLLPGVPSPGILEPGVLGPGNCGPGEQAGAPAAVVARMGMMQAQDLAQACWAVGVRVPGSTLEQIHAALESGGIVRSWGARGTLMFLDPQLVRPLLSITAPRMHAQAAGTWRRENLTDAELGRLLPVAVERCGTAGASRAELLAAIAEAGSDTAGQRGYHLLVALSLTGDIVQGPMEPGSQTRQLFMASSRWLRRTGTQPAAGDPAHAPPANALPANALEDIVLRYFRSHGPATVADCAWWLGLGLAPVRTALQTVGCHLARREAGGLTYLLAPEIDALWDDAPGEGSMLALPGFDEFLLGYKDRAATLAPEHADAITPGGNGVFRRILVDGGQTVGTWQIPAKARAKTQAKAKDKASANTKAKAKDNAVGDAPLAVPFDAGVAAGTLARMRSSMEGYLAFRAAGRP